MEMGPLQLTATQGRTSTSPQSSTINQNVTQEEVDKKAWKYIRYKGYADFIASENNFFVLRTFASISARIALSLQDQVTVLENRLGELEKQYSSREARDVNNGSFRDNSVDRAKLYEELRVKLMRYCEVFRPTAILTNNEADAILLKMSLSSSKQS
jgi:hypothetical protein